MLLQQPNNTLHGIDRRSAGGGNLLDAACTVNQIHDLKQMSTPFGVLGGVNMNAVARQKNLACVIGDGGGGWGRGEGG